MQGCAVISVTSARKKLLKGETELVDDDVFHRQGVAWRPHGRLNKEARWSKVLDGLLSHEA